MKRLLALLATPAFVVVLASCGGGSGDASSNAPPSSSPPPPAAVSVSLYESSSTPAPPQAAADRATNAFNWTNYRRAQIGLAPFLRNAALDRAAAAHVGYIVLNNSYSSEGHSETSGKPGFTGTAPTERAAAAGYAGSGIGENIAGVGSTLGVDATDSLVDAPYHRQAQFSAFAEAGAGASSAAAGVYVIDFGGVHPNPGPARNQLVVYPADGAAAAPLDWLANETPNPVPDLAGQRVGYPISIGSGMQQLVVTSFTLQDDKGVPITSRLLTKRTDTSQSLQTFAFIVPLAPLAAGTKYTAKAAGSVEATPFAVSWSFTTIPVATLMLTPSSTALGAAAGSTVRVTASGGTGRFSLAAGSGYSYVGPAPGQVEFFSSELLSPSVLNLVRNAVPCSGNLSRCSASVVVEDSAGTRVVVNLVVN